MITQGKVFLGLCLAVCTTNQIQASRVLFASDRHTAGWSLAAGAGFAPESIASMQAFPHEKGIHLEMDFPPGADYAGIEHPVNFGESVDAIAFTVESDSPFHGVVILEDAGGEKFLARYEGQKGRQTKTFKLDEATFSQSWGGPADHRMDHPVKAFLTGASSRDMIRGKLVYTDFKAQGDWEDPLPSWKLHLDAAFSSGILPVGQVASGLSLQITNCRETAAEGRLRVEVTTANGTRQMENQPIATGPFETVSVATGIDLSRTGYYKVVVHLEDGEKPISWTVAVATVLPPAIRENAMDGFFGICEMEDLTAARRMGMQHLRSLVHWNTSEPSDGVFRLHRAAKIAETTREHDLGVILTAVIRQPPAWLPQQSPLLLPSTEAAKRYRRFMKELAKVLSLPGVQGAVEIQNEPDIVFLHLHKASVEESATSAAFLIREGAEAVRAINPDLPVLGMGVSGLDFRQGLALSRQTLPHTGKALDYLSPHPYTQKRFIGSENTEFPGEYGFMTYLEDAAELARQHTRKGTLWLTELGWGLAPEADLLSAEAMEHAAVVSRTLVLARSNPEAGKFTWFTGQSAWREKGYDFSLFRKMEGQWFPLPSAAAFATTASLLEEAAPVSQTTIGNRRGFHFSDAGKGLDIFVFWKTGRDGKASIFIPEGALQIDLLGHKRSLTTVLEKTLSSAPVFFLIPLNTAELSDFMLD